MGTQNLVIGSRIAHPLHGERLEATIAWLNESHNPWERIGGECKKLLANSDLKELFPGIFVLATDGMYRQDIGLVMGEALSAASLAS